MSRFRTVTALAAILTVALTASADPPAKVALTGGRIIPVVGDEIAEGTILVENGRITAIGADVDVPYDFAEVDCAGKVLMPGMFDAHSSRGLDIPNENLPVASFLDVYDAIDPSRSAFEDALRDGVTSIHVMQANNCVIGGVSRVVHPIGMVVDDMTQAEDIGIKLSVSPKSGYDRMRQMAELREAFHGLDDYLERLAEKKYEDSLEENGEKIAVGPAEAREQGKDLITDEDYDDAHRNLVRLRRGDIGAWIYCGAATDVGPALSIAEQQGFLATSVLVVGPETHKAIRELGDADRPVVLPAGLFHRERDAISGELTETFLPKVFHDAGIDFALVPNPGGSLAERYLNYQAAMCVRYGVPRSDALEAITLTPAQMVGLGDSHGSLEVGKVANITVMSGDPLDFESWVDLVFINGTLAYDRTRDHRLQELLSLERRMAEAAAAAESADETSDDEAASEDTEATTDAAASDADAGDGEGSDDGDGSE